MALAVANWVRDELSPLSARFGTIHALDIGGSFECRDRNRVAGTKPSEHGRANALDILSFNFGNGQSFSLVDPRASRDLREKVLASVCSRFSTVLGPGSDGYHEDHIHIDLMERRNNYKICQWDVREDSTSSPAEKVEGKSVFSPLR